jgi:O-methyltransferase
MPAFLEHAESFVRKGFRTLGLELTRYEPLRTKYRDMDPAFFELYERCRPFTMTSVERMYAVYNSLTYLERNGIDGDIVECGVWRGGTCMLAALRLQQLGASNRRLMLYDTFAGMPAPTTADRAHDDDLLPEWEKQKADDHNEWCYASLEEVRANLYSTGYSRDLITFVQGRVEETIPATLPRSIALLRLDTDWYESTAHELTHLYPRLVANGVIVIDDYGHWRGSRDAVDEYITREHLPLCLQRVDHTCRLAIKVATASVDRPAPARGA